MASKTATTFNIDTEVKMDFKIECVKNGVEMGVTVENMMIDYVKVSRQLHEERKAKHEE